MVDQDEDEYLYIYAQTMDGRTQYGILTCSQDDYLSEKIKKHELTLKAKKKTMIHIRNTNANVEPVFSPIRLIKDR